MTHKQDRKSKLKSRARSRVRQGPAIMNKHVLKEGIAQFQDLMSTMSDEGHHTGRGKSRRRGDKRRGSKRTGSKSRTRKRMM
jgi:hypothetical protein